MSFQVILISPYSQVEAYGLRSLSACLKRAGFPTRLIFLPDIEEMMVGKNYGARRLSGSALDQVIELCAGAGLIGVSTMTTSFHLACALTEAVHRQLEAPVIWGGVHPTVRPAECLQHADLICIGEGERAIVELARRMAAGHDHLDVPNLGYLDKNGQLILNPLYPLEYDLDNLPFPDYDYEEHYVLHEGELQPFTQELMYYYLTDLGSWARGPVYGVLTTRGCPYHCTYCVNDALINIYPEWCKLRRRTPENVIAEIQSARDKLPGLEAIAIRDDTFLANPEDYIAHFCQLYKQSVGLPFRAYTTAQTANERKLHYLSEAGLRLAIMGIQSGSAHTQKMYNRKVDNEHILRAARLINSFQAYIPRPMYDVITDNPYESQQDQYETLRLVHELPTPYRLSLFSLTFYPGTELYHKALADGIIQEDDPDIYVRNFQMVQPTFYNFALFCHGLNLPRLFLSLLSWRIVFSLGSREPFNRISGWLLYRILALRLRSNDRLYTKRRQEWLSGQNTENRA